MLPPEIRTLNPREIDRLVECFNRYEYVVPFIGAGMSVPFGYPSWTGFLRGAAKDANRSAEVANSIAKGMFDDAAQIICDAFGQSVFDDLITQTFGDNGSKAKGAEPLVVVPHITTGLVITTNFDSKTKDTFAENDAPLELARGPAIDTVVGASLARKPLLWHVHGTADERSNRVVTASDYRRAYPDERPDKTIGVAVDWLLERVFVSQRMLFLGCSLLTDRTVQALQNAHGKNPVRQHFAILEEPVDSDKIHRTRQLGEMGICPIWYPAGRYDLIYPTLRWIESNTAESIAHDRPSARRQFAIVTYDATPSSVIAHPGCLDLRAPFASGPLADEAAWTDLVAGPVSRFARTMCEEASACVVQLNCRLAVAFCLGTNVPIGTGINIVILQQGISGPREWSPRWGEDSGLRWNITKAAVGSGQDIVLSVHAGHGTLKEPPEFASAEIPSAGTLIEAQMENTNATAAVSSGAHAYALAQELIRIVSDTRSAKTSTHIFYKGPIALAFFLGQLHKSLGPGIFYEYNSPEASYVPAIHFP